MATFASMTKANKKTNPNNPEGSELQQVLCIYSFVLFCKLQVEMLINLDSKVYKIWPSFAKKLVFYLCNTNVNVEKIDNHTLKMFGIVIALFRADDKDGKSCLFEKTLLLADMSI